MKMSKRTILLVVLILTVTFSVVGGTFAWFTDSVESAGNEIQSGTLDLELYQKAENGQWQNVADLTEPMFSYDLWEPGYTMWKALKVENKGTLALKWKAMFEMEGEMSKLAEVIDVYAREGSAKPERSEIPANSKDTSPTNPSSQWWYDGTLKDFIENSETNTYGSLKAGESKELTLVLKMREEAGNEYQNLTLGAFDLKIVATQDTVEKDSFDDQYDADAEYSIVKVGTVEELIAALQRGKNHRIELTGDIIIDKDDVPNFMFKDSNGAPLYLYHTDITLDLNDYNIIVKEDALLDGKTNANGAFVVRYSTLNIEGTGSIITENKSINVYGWAHSEININGGTYISNASERNESAIYVNNSNVMIHVYGGDFTQCDYAFNAHDNCGNTPVITLHEGIEFKKFLKDGTTDVITADINAGRIVLADGCVLEDIEINGQPGWKVVKQ